MGQLGGFRYRDITKRLKQLGLEFHRQAAGSHEIWYHPITRRYTTIPPQAGRHRARPVPAEEVQAIAAARARVQRTATCNGVAVGSVSEAMQDDMACTCQQVHSLLSRSAR